MPRLTLQETMDRLLLLVKAGTPVIYVTSHEESRVLDYVARMARVIKHHNPTKHLFTWYQGEGHRHLRNLAPYPTPERGKIDWLGMEPGLPAQPDWQPDNADAALALNNIRVLDLRASPVVANSLTVFHDLHPYLQTTQPLLVRTLRNAASRLRDYYDANRSPHNPSASLYKTIVIVAPTDLGLSPELERDVIRMEFPLPEQDELRLAVERLVGKGLLRLPEGMLTDKGKPNEEGKRLIDRIAGAGRGLTLEEFKLGLNDFAVRGEELSDAHMEDMLHRKAKAVTNEALSYTPHVEVKLGGLGDMSGWIRKRRDPVLYNSVREKYHLPPLKGALICGVSGGGKSMMAKLIAREFDLALLRLDVGALFGSYVGESEQRTREALRLAEVLAPVVLWLDEVDKAFAGIGGGGDSGVSARVFGTFLTWLAEKQDNVFVVATANNFKVILDRFPEFGRKGRFDQIFWTPLPSQEGRREIFEQYLRPQFAPDFLSMSADELSRVTGGLAAPAAPGADTVARFCDFLSHPNQSAQMTGAEIEHAVKECLYEVYDLAQRGGPGNPDAEVSRIPGDEVGRLIVTTLRKLADQAVYKNGTPADAERAALELLARKSGWPFLGGERLPQDAAAPVSADAGFGPAPIPSGVSQ